MGIVRIIPYGRKPQIRFLFRDEKETPTKEAKSESEGRYRWKCWDGREQQEGRRRRPMVASTARGEERWGEKEREKDIWSREVSPYNRLGSLTYEASFACHLLHHLASRCSFCAPFPGTSSSSFSLAPPSALLARSRCTVAFGLCIIITVTTSSSWLVVVEESHLVSPFATATNPVNVVLSRQALLEPCPP